MCRGVQVRCASMQVHCADVPSVCGWGGVADMLVCVHGYAKVRVQVRVWDLGNGEVVVQTGVLLRSLLTRAWGVVLGAPRGLGASGGQSLPGHYRRAVGVQPYADLTCSPDSGSQ